MKAVLYVPDEWGRGSRYADLLRPDYLSGLGECITRGLQLSVPLFLYCDLPLSFPVSVEWVATPRNPQPTLLIEAEGTRSNPLRVDFDVVKSRLAEAIRQGSLPTLIPDCRVVLRIILETSIHL